MTTAPHLGSPLTYETAMYPCRLQAQARRNKAKRLKKQKGNGSGTDEEEEGSENSSGARQDQSNGAMQESTPAPLTTLEAGGRWSFDEGLLPFEDARGTHGLAAARADEIWERVWFNFSPYKCPTVFIITFPPLTNIDNFFFSLYHRRNH